MLGELALVEAGDLLDEDLAGDRILVAQIDVDGLGLDGPGADQHALEEGMRIALEEVAILEGADLALVAVDGHHARFRRRSDEAPFAARREAGAAEAAQPAVVQRLHHLLDGDVAGQTLGQNLVAALGDILVEALVVGHDRMRVIMGDRLADALDSGVVDMVVPDLAGRRQVAAAHAGRPEHADVLHLRVRQPGEKIFRAGHRAAQRFADPDGDGFGPGLVVTHDVEMGVEGRDLVDLRHRDAHLVGERLQQASRQAAFGLLDEVEVLDQHVALKRRRADDLMEAILLLLRERPPLVEDRRLAASGTRVMGTLLIGHCRFRHCRFGRHETFSVSTSLSFRATDGGVGGDDSACVAQALDLAAGIATAEHLEGAGVAHAPLGRGVAAGDEGDNRLRRAGALEEVGCLLFL